MGSNPSHVDQERFKQSQQYNSEKQVFENRQADLFEKMNARFSLWSNLRKWLEDAPDRAPGGKLPEVRPDMEEFMSTDDDVKIIWFGHSTFLMNLGGKTVLVDPIFSNNAAPVSFLVERFQPPVLSIHELPPIDYIVISHDHYDHLDMESIRFFRDKSPTFLVPLGVGSHLRAWGIDQKMILEKDWWESFEADGITFTATPAQHFSGRGLSNRNSTLWASWVIQTPSHRIFFSGDSGYDTHFKSIGEKLGPFDLALLDNGQYNIDWREVHLLPEEAITAINDLNAKKFFPVHWGMFVLSYHTWYEPIEKAFALSRKNNIELVAPKIGEVLYVNRTSTLEAWWRRVKSSLPGT